MDFFAQQTRSRRNSRLAMALFVAATMTVIASVCFLAAAMFASLEAQRAGRSVLMFPHADVWRTHAETLIWVAVGTAMVIAVGSLAKVLQLRGGGGEVARKLGGRLVGLDPESFLEKRLVNIVSEVAIASGVPVPEIYILDGQAGINAFAAGFGTHDAAIGVTRGAVEQLSRDELQGVIAHEFSHVLNGDMRLNLRMVGILHGILMIGATGQTILRGSFFHSARSRGGRMGRRGGAVPWLAVLGIALWLLGVVGVVFARLIKAALSRQREYLADASAVQFTRDPAGLAGALKKIGGLTGGARIQSAQAEAISHLFFGPYRHFRAQWLSTHPPLVARIRALEPGFDAGEFARIEQLAEDGIDPERLVSQAAAGSPGGGGDTAANGDVDAQVGQPHEGDLRFARNLLAALPETVRVATTVPSQAQALVLLLLEDTEVVSERATDFELDAQALATLAEDVASLPVQARLPLVELLIPALRRLPAARLQRFLQQLQAAARADGRITVFEYSLLTVLECTFADVMTPRRAIRADRRQRGLTARLKEVRVVLTVLSTIAQAPEEAQNAYARAGRTLLGSRELAPLPEQPMLSQFDQAVRRLDDLADNVKRQVVRACASVIAHDQRIEVREAELLRALCEVWRCPLPPHVAQAAWDTATAQNQRQG